MKRGQEIPREVQRLIGDLRAVWKRTTVLRDRLPEVTDAMVELAEPFTPEAEMAMALEGVALDLEPLPQRLEEAAAVTPEQLREEWERARRP